jgi:hypothetical protein
MNKLGKIGIILAGYAVALSVACVLVYIRQLQTSGPDAQASAGMYAWGDFMLFIGSFTVLALVPTGLGLYFLRPYEKVWTVLSVLALAVAITGPVGACLSALALNLRLQKSVWEFAGQLGFLRTMGAPLLALGFFTCAAFAPSRRPRLAMLAAAGLECAASAYFFIHLWMARGV